MTDETTRLCCLCVEEINLVLNSGSYGLRNSLNPDGSLLIEESISTLNGAIYAVHNGIKLRMPDKTPIPLFSVTSVAGSESCARHVQELLAHQQWRRYSRS